MNILAKFETVTIKAAIRLAEADRRFCEAHENAYKNAPGLLSGNGIHMGGYLQQTNRYPVGGRFSFPLFIHQRRPGHFR